MEPTLPGDLDAAPAIGGSSPAAMVNINGYLFPPGTVLPETQKELAKYEYPHGASADRRRTLRNQQNIAAGLHPTGWKLREPAGQTCGSCNHCRKNATYNRTFYKCGLMRGSWTRGSGSDIRIKWPACSLWDPMPAVTDPSIGIADSAIHASTPQSVSRTTP